LPAVTQDASPSELTHPRAASASLKPAAASMHRAPHMMETDGGH
jgi:hypothetical protein